MDGRNVNVPIAILYVLLGLLGLGLIAVTWFFMQTLQENSDSMRKVQLNPPVSVVETMPKTLESSDGKLREVGISTSGNDVDQNLRAESDKYFAMGKQLAGKQEFSNAIECFGKSSKLLAMDIDGGNHLVGDADAVASRFAILGACYYRLGQLEPAEKELSWAINSMPDNALLYYERALIQRKLKNEYQAMTDWQMAKNLRIDPDRAKNSGAWELMFGKDSPDTVMKNFH